ncbi:hypothetical protein ACFFUT_17765 [Pseudohalocynthiibacter aestuariivivens]|jgi:hypothetical protein|uniref:Antibiotic biosynthesis monooxygenase n=1 Tax=Pseudohalocynthiibacter aestuariivivens TaxID=1591409 RepID=A0ABV5JKL6_9RHOB|nr:MULTISPECIES: hypothetical protein [Pseudohalocynthiibacter]MBS9718229.1 hypothetical protein [Pseudohalocynthiibacter aestuariivivens]MCK0103452.1 hypothetical protein [Pseudohalocynthiibacter sp. F2068]
MFARITTYKLKPGTVEASEKMLERIKPQILALAGLKHFINAVDADGNGYIISIVESEEISNANQAKVAELWQSFGEFLAEPPKPGGYRVIMNESVG